MKLRRFVAPDARSGLEKIRQALGPDAVVVTSRKIAGGVEIMAGSYAELGADTGDDAGRGLNVQRPQQESATQGGHAVWRELARLRSLLQNQLAGLAWSAEKRRHPVRIHVMQRMLASGFSPQLARHVAAGLPRHYSENQSDAWLRQVLIRNLRVFAPSEMPDKAAGVWALVGPTGHGKTTTLAKLAARAVLRHGPRKVALVSADAYRIGAQQQLETYARMMGVDSFVLEDIHQLGGVLSELADRFCVLIDSAGFAPQDQRFAEQISVLKQNSAHCLLAVSASSQGNLMERLIQHSQPQGVILTKLDEGGLCGPVLDCMMRHRMPLACLATGQQVPEDLHLANAAYVVDRALRARDQGAFAMREEDWPVQLGADDGNAASASESSAGMERRQG
jgi:flagellar biosynthesis protein FlhF